MKNYLKITAVIGLMFTTVTGMANEPEIDLKNGIDGKSIVLKLDSQSADSNIRLIDSDGNVLFYENSGGKNLNKKFNLENLEEGIYSLKVDSEFSSFIYNVTVGDETVIIEKGSEVKNKPVARQIDKKVYLNYLNSSLSPVNISILDNNDNVVYEETRESELIVKGIYNLYRAPKGDYRLMVKFGNETYFENIVIK
jgi:Secretion system C-terminal sorting domain